MKTGNRRSAVCAGAFSIILSMTLAAGLGPVMAGAAEGTSGGGA